MAIVESEQFTVVIILYHQAIVFIEQTKTLRNAFDGIGELHPCLVKLSQIVFFNLDRCLAKTLQGTGHVRNFVVHWVDNRFVEITVGDGRHVGAEAIQSTDNTPVDIKPYDKN